MIAIPKEVPRDSSAKCGKRKKQIDPTKALTDATRAFLAKVLVPDLRDRTRHRDVASALRQQHQREVSSNKAVGSFEKWVEQVIVQVGAAWVLSCVFVRTLEDRSLLDRRRLTGPEAEDSEAIFFQLAPSLSARDYLLTVFRELASFPSFYDVMMRYNPVWRLGPSAEVAQELLDFFRKPQKDGSLRWTFEAQPYSGDPSGTRILGDLYQNISDDVRKDYALCQTPHFVESFILGQTLDPAISEFGLNDLRVIDPTCGSGHFLIGAYHRLFNNHLLERINNDPREAAGLALAHLYGADINPYAVAIARFRLTISYLQCAGFKKLKNAPTVSPNLAVADSLLHAAHRQRDLSEQPNIPASTRDLLGGAIFDLENRDTAVSVFSKRHHVVIGNPPYITCKNRALREQYRKMYRSASGKFAQSAPFTELMFQLAEDSGYIGFINANSFMKREFGKALIEKVLPQWELSRVIDTSGAYIPGHGTPTVILFGRNRPSASAFVPTVQGKRGEPQTPDDPEHGLVWSSIAEHFKEVGFENDFISVVEVPRETFRKHPWSLGGGGASELKEYLEQKVDKRLGDMVEDIGFASFTGLDDAFILPLSAARTWQLEDEVIRTMVVGENVRDWAFSTGEVALTPYRKHDHSPFPLAPSAKWGKFLWRFRTVASNVSSFGGKTRQQEGQNWWEWYRWQAERYATAYRIAFAFVATHNHFVLDRGGKVFKQTAPIIKLPESATEEDHLALLAYLNSSTACFWMKQSCFDKGGSGEDWEQRFEYDGTKLKGLPVFTAANVARLGAMGDEFAARIKRLSPADVFDEIINQSRSLEEATSLLSKAKDQQLQNLAKLVAVQESIDWQTYNTMGLVDEELTFDADAQLMPSQRAFEILSAQDDRGSDWFSRHCRKPVLNLDGLTSTQAEIIKKQIQEIRNSTYLSLLESKLFKRRFYPLSWDTQLVEAANEWIAEWIEANLKEQLNPIDFRSLTRTAASDDRVSMVARLANVGDDIPRALMEIFHTNSVPFVRWAIFSEAGLATFNAWEEVWELQRREDAGEDVGEIPVPPKYKPKDYRSPVYWKLRGKLDVPKERFISYPGCESDENPSPVIGWAGWNHLQRAQALVALYQDRKNVEGWEASRLVPMLAGLLELIPWLKQWHNEPDPEFDDQRLGDTFEEFLEGQLSELSLTKDALRAWRPPKAARKKRTKKSS